MAYERAGGDRSSNESLLTQASTLDSNWSTISSGGGADRQRIVNIHGLENYRDLWPDLVRDIYDAVPTIPGTPDEIKKQFPDRSQRKQIFVDDVLSQFMPDLTTALSGDLKQFVQAPANQPSGGGFGGTGNRGFVQSSPTPSPSQNGAASGKRGFVLTIYGTTPNKDGLTFVEKTFVTELRALAEKSVPPGTPFYIAKAQVVSGTQIISDTNKLSALKSSYDAAMHAREANVATPIGGGRSGLPPTEMRTRTSQANTGADAAAEDTTAYKDRLTGEDIRHDWEFTVVAVVALDPQPKPPAGAQ
jgi:hypothetical protein